MSEIYNRIEALCKKKGINITEMCRTANISRGILSDFKMGRTKKLSTDTLEKLSVYFHVSVDFLLTGEEKTDKPSETEELSVEERVEQILSGMDSNSTLMLDGKAMSPEAIEAFRNSLIISVELARKLNKEKEGKRHEDSRN